MAKTFKEQMQSDRDFMTRHIKQKEAELANIKQGKMPEWVKSFGGGITQSELIKATEDSISSARRKLDAINKTIK